MKNNEYNLIILLIILAVIFSILVLINYLVTGDMGKSYSQNNCEEVYAYGQYHERCYDDNEWIDKEYEKDMQEMYEQQQIDGYDF